MNPISDAVPVTDAAPDPQTPAGAARAAGGDAFAALLAAAAALGPPPTPGQAEAARTAPAEGTKAGSDSPGSNDAIPVTLPTAAAAQTTATTQAPKSPSGSPGQDIPAPAAVQTTQEYKSPSGSPGQELPAPAAVQATQEYKSPSGLLGEEIDGATPEPSVAATAPDDPAAAPAADPDAPAAAEPRTPDSENPAAIAYAQKRLQQLVRAGVIERVPDGDPTAAWRELSQDIRAIAEHAGYADPREFLARGQVTQEPGPARTPAEAPVRAPTATTPSAENGADIPISFSTVAESRQTAPTEQSAPAVQPAGSSTVRGGGAVPAETSTRDESKRNRETAAPRATETTSPAGASANAPAQVAPAVEREHPAVRPVTAHLHELVDKAQATIRVAVRDGHTDARITLRPHELGEVRITLRYEGGGVSALLTADSAKAVEMLAQASADLRRSLEQQGLTVHGLDVRLAGEDARQGAAPWRDGGQSAPTHGGAYREDEDHDQAEGTEPATRVTEAGRIDVLA